MGVNFACFWQFSVIAKKAGGERRLLRDAILPLIGFAFCGVIWFNLNVHAKTVGGIWFRQSGYSTWDTRRTGSGRSRWMIDFSDN